jgi:hypothetical protein
MKTISLYDVTVPVFVKSLTQLSAWIDKAKFFAEEKKINETTLLQSRLILDQLSFTKQVQIACDNAKGCVARLAGIEAPIMDDAEVSFAELQARIERTIAFLEIITPEQLVGGEERKIELHYFPGKHMLGSDYLTSYALRNFLFHITTAYSILRHHGVNIGKQDFMGELPLRDNE